MAELHTFIELRRGPRADFIVLLSTFAFTVFFDLTIGVAAGLIMAVVLFLRQMEEVTHIRLITEETEDPGTGSHSIRERTFRPTSSSTGSRDLCSSPLPKNSTSRYGLR